MCGIFATLRCPTKRPTPQPNEIIDPLNECLNLISQAQETKSLEHLTKIVVLLTQVDTKLRGVAGLRLMLQNQSLVFEVSQHCQTLRGLAKPLEAFFEKTTTLSSSVCEQALRTLDQLADGIWAISKDRLTTAQNVAELSNQENRGIETYLSISQALASLDRLEVRGRDSAGIHLLIRDHALDLSNPATKDAITQRYFNNSFLSKSVRVVNGHLSFVYKVAASIGELGDNSALLRQTICNDELLASALANDSAQTAVLAHTRWASVGVVSEPNAHPLNSELTATAGPYVVAALNGDVDNYAELIVEQRLDIPATITTDAKVIPTIMSQQLANGHSNLEAFRRTVASFEGSVAVAAHTASAPSRLALALRGSGQALYVGIAQDAFVVASEPYGIVEETSKYLRMEGETAGNPENPNASRGQIIELSSTLAGTLAGINRSSYDGTKLPISSNEVVTTEITNRDIDRGDNSHYLLKELKEAPQSFRKTLRGKIISDASGPTVVLSRHTLPEKVRKALSAGKLKRIIAIGQGTAAVAAESLALTLAQVLPDGLIMSESMLATELSGFCLRADMSDTLVVAISQSGTTTDTNRTVEIVRNRGAAVVAIVNRRSSDLTDRADGVLYTSDGRDVEMSVASTKAFYAQVAAGLLLAICISEELAPDYAPQSRSSLLSAIGQVPAALETILARRENIAEAARQFTLSRRYWAIVGNGPNRIAAQELRIKLSELCYKSIAVDVTEDKKHIDLSSEPLIVVCAAGLRGSTANDVAKEVAIFRAHKAAPIVIADDGESRFDSALVVLPVPVIDSRLGFILSAMVGHLFGYEAALAVDGQAQLLREARSAIEDVTTCPQLNGERALARVRTAVERVAALFFDGLQSGDYNGHLETSSAVRLASLFRFARGVVPLEAYQLEYGKVGTPAVVVDDLALALDLCIDELTRPIDAIKHQAKTVTVGVSRTDETLLEVPLAFAALAAGAPRDSLSYASLRTLADLNPAVDEVLGHTRYRVEGLYIDDLNTAQTATATVVSKAGISNHIVSRTETHPQLRGTKHQVAVERRLLVARGRADERCVIIIPELKGNQTTGLTLLHVRFVTSLSVSTACGVLRGYRNRYSALCDTVVETEGVFREEFLANQNVADLLTLPISQLADRWRG